MSYKTVRHTLSCTDILPVSITIKVGTLAKSQRAALLLRSCLLILFKVNRASATNKKDIGKVRKYTSVQLKQRKRGGEDGEGKGGKGRMMRGKT